MPLQFNMARPQASGGARPVPAGGKAVPALAGLNRAIGGPRAGSPQAVANSNGGAGNPGDPAMWTMNPMGQKFNWQPRDINGQGGKWGAVGQTPEQDAVQQRAVDQRDNDNEWNRQREWANHSQTLDRNYMLNDEARRRAMMKEDITTITGTPSASDPGMIPRVPTEQAGGDDAAAALAFGRAKDQAGLATRGLMKSVRHNMASRGISGSGIEGGASMDVLAGGADRVAQAGLAEALHKVQRGNDVSDRNYAGNINQRGQDIAQQQALADRAEARRRQTIEMITRLYGSAY